MNSLQNCQFTFEDSHMRPLTLFCNSFMFSAIVSWIAGQMTIPRTFMLGEEVMKVEKEDYVNALVQLSKDSTMLHKSSS